MGGEEAEDSQTVHEVSQVTSDSQGKDECLFMFQLECGMFAFLILQCHSFPKSSNFHKLLINV